jgi:hypothetical protein
MDSRRLGMIVALVLLLWAAATWIVLRIYRVSVETYYRVQGIKTYIVGTAFIAHAILGWWLGDLDPRAATDRVLEGLGTMSLRAGVAKARPLPAPPSPVADGAESETS